jgi:IS605 OrfB family transposase
MGHATRTTELPLDLGKRRQGGTNTGKRAFLEETVALLNAARAFYIDFFLTHADKLAERVAYFSEAHLEMRERPISANELLTWAEACTVVTPEHPHPWAGWNFNERFPGMPFFYRRSVIKDAIGKVKAFRSNLANWQRTGKKKGKPGVPGEADHPTLYQGALSLELEDDDVKQRFVKLKVYTGKQWTWANYPVRYSRYFEQRHRDAAWEPKSPILVLRPHEASLHFPQAKEIKAKKVRESKGDPDLVTVAVDLNVKNLAVITVRQHGKIIESVFVTDHGLDQHRYRHLKRISKKQWLSGKPVKGEQSNQPLWRHVHRMNEDASHQVSRVIANVCARYQGCVLLFERLRTIKIKGNSKSRRMNRKRANQLRGKINQWAREKAFAEGIVTVEVNPHGTSQYCSRCGAKGERFSYRGGQRIKAKWGKLFRCSVCNYEASADFNGSANVHHSFYHEWHWQPRLKRSG